MDIFLRPPSATWESIELPAAPGAAVWAWFRPPAAPCGIVFQIPPESYDAHPKAFTVRRLLNALGVDCRMTRMCFARAAPFDAMQGMNPLLDRPLLTPPPGIDPTITVHLAPPNGYAVAPAFVPTPPNGYAVAPAFVAAPPVVYVSQQTLLPERGSEALYHAIESDWHAIQILESKNLMLRKQLNSQLTRLMSLNRDLSPEERNATDALDHRDWQDARRWIRDGAAVLSRVVRAHDIGATSAAGNRNRFDDIINQFITPRRPIENLGAVQHQFEVHRKTVQSLHTEMQSAAHGPGHDGETKALAVQNRIRTKVQASRGKR